MKIAIMSDIHANQEALVAAIREAKSRGVDKFAILGDVVGYGGSPNECIKIIRSRNDVLFVLQGNHDEAVGNNYDTSTSFNKHASKACDIHQNVVTRENKEWLRNLPYDYSLNVDGWRLVFTHGNLPNHYAYILTDEEEDRAALYAAASEKDIMFFGHSHIPLYSVYENNGVGSHVEVFEDFFSLKGYAHEQRRKSYLKVKEFYASARRYAPRYGISGAILKGKDVALFNVGSVGQPRDEDEKGKFLTFDTKSGLFQYNAFRYDIDSAADKIMDIGMPAFLAQRLYREVKHGSKYAVGQ